MAKTIAQLRQEAQTIRDASAVGENTATRVGGAIEDVVDYLESHNFATSKEIEIDLTDSLTWSVGYNIWAKTGGSGDTAMGAKHSTTTGQSASDFVDLSGFSKIRVTMPSSEAEVSVGMAFYSSQLQSSCISAISVSYEGAVGWSYVTKTYTIPQGGNYARFTKLPSGTFSLIGIKVQEDVQISGYENTINMLLGKIGNVSITNVLANGANGDGVTDDTSALQDIFDVGGVIYIPKGTYIISRTLTVRDGTMIVGDGLRNTVIKAKNGSSLTAIEWRGTAGAATTHSTIYPILMTEPNSHNITLMGIGVYDDGVYTSGNGKTRTGILSFYTDVMSIIDCGAEHINWLDPSERTMDFYAEIAGFSLFVLHSTNVRVCGGKYEFGGYESVGTETSHNVYFDNCYIGSGWRCAFQVHRDCYNVHLENCTVRQEIAISDDNRFTSSAVILDGRSVDGLHDIFIDNNHIYGIVTTYQGGGGVKCVLANEYNIFVRGNFIETNFRGVADQEESASGFRNPKNWIITDNMITAPYGIYHRRVKGIIVKNNIIDASISAITINSAAYIVHDNVLINNQTISLTGTNVSN